MPSSNYFDLSEEFQKKLKANKSHNKKPQIKSIKIRKTATKNPRITKKSWTGNDKMIGVSYIFLVSGFIFVLSFIFWVWILADCLRKETDEGNTRLIWVIVIVFTFIVGALLYYLIRRPKRVKELGRYAKGVQTI